MEGKQELTYKNAIVLLKEYIQSTGKKQTDVAAELGVSGGAGKQLSGRNL